MKNKQQFWDDTFIAAIAAFCGNTTVVNMEMSNGTLNALVVDARTIADTATDLREEILKNRNHVSFEFVDTSTFI